MQYLKIYLDDFHWLILVLCEEKLKSYKKQTIDRKTNGVIITNGVSKSN